MLRVAALNNAAYEWIQHEPIGRKAGLTSAQLYAIRDVETPLPDWPSTSSAKRIFCPLLLSGLHFTDALTLVPPTLSSEPSAHLHPSKLQPPILETCLAFKHQLRLWVEDEFGPIGPEALVEDLYAEGVLVVTTYNLVSRFLISTDVDGLGDAEVPWPIDRVDVSIVSNDRRSCA